jgi:hypothetical protein
MEMIARKSGRLLKGGDPCVRTAAINLINDFQRGRLPHYVAPPELKEEAPVQAPAEAAVVAVQQDLDAIGEEHMEKLENGDENEKSAVNDEEGDKSLSDDKHERKVAAKAESSDSEDEEEAPTVSLIGAGDWED